LDVTGGGVASGGGASLPIAAIGNQDQEQTDPADTVGGDVGGLPGDEREDTMPRNQGRTDTGPDSDIDDVLDQPAGAAPGSAAGPVAEPGQEPRPAIDDLLDSVASPITQPTTQLTTTLQTTQPTEFSEPTTPSQQFAEPTLTDPLETRPGQPRRTPDDPLQRPRRFDDDDDGFKRLVGAFNSEDEVFDTGVVQSFGELDEETTDPDPFADVDDALDDLNF
jgi:hypothetical protein